MKGINLKSIAELGKMGLRAMNRNLPTILSGAAIAGVIATVWTTYKAAPEIESSLESAKWDKEQDLTGTEEAIENTDEVKLNGWETFKAVAPYIWKPALCGTFTIGCIVGAQVLNVQRLTMLAGAYKLSEEKLKTYEEKAKELLGEKKETELHDEVAKEMTPEPPIDDGMIAYTGKGDQLCYDTFSGRYFYSSTETIRQVESRLNKKIVCGEFVHLNDLYHELGLENVKFGDAFGWEAYHSGNRTYYLDIRLTYDEKMVGNERKVACIMDYNVDMDADNFHTRLC